jgi:uncharacterized protein YbaR (Trm112 family)
MSETKKPTPEQVQRYIANNGQQCLFCRSTQFVSLLADCTTQCHEARMPIRCEHCGKSWVDVYRLGAVELPNQDDEDETVEPATPPPYACAHCGNADLAKIKCIEDTILTRRLVSYTGDELDIESKYEVADEGDDNLRLVCGLCNEEYPLSDEIPIQWV